MTGDLGEILKEYWGYDRFMPLQHEAMLSVVAGRDSVVVLPTGGGKSLCYQAPAIAMPGMAIVVSPLISLMKDQVDALIECGVPAARIDSSMSPQEKNNVREGVRQGALKLLYVSPERIVTENFTQYLMGRELSFIAVDEAHCVSMWGHDFRPEYRQLGLLKNTFPGIAIHAYTATATQHVRDDIAKQLSLADPEVLVGSFDRPNLVYKVERRGTIVQQVRGVIDRHEGESGIVYCIRRKDVDSLCDELVRLGYKALPYHAGMDPADRRRNQDAFAREQADTIIATVAFGMGIDKSNVRYVIHTGMPKTLEHYQQESGRAGRDGLEADCTLFFSGADYGVWRAIMSDLEAEAGDIAMSKLSDMYRYCTNATCRHRALVEYFGQTLDEPNCGACDFCSGGIECIDDPLTTAQKILSCVVRLRQNFGAAYTAQVLTGSREQRILDNAHDTLSTYALLSDYSKRVVHDWIEQLVGQGYVERVGEFNVLHLTASGMEILRGTGTPRLTKPPTRTARKSKAITDSWDGVDDGLFEKLRNIRRDIADKKKVPAYVVFGDAALRDMARIRPSNPNSFLEVKGVGAKKRDQYGDVFISVIVDYCRANSLSSDIGISPDLL